MPRQPHFLHISTPAFPHARSRTRARSVDTDLFVRAPPSCARGSRSVRQDQQQADAKKRKVVDEALKAQKFPTELLAQLPTPGWGVPSQPKPSAEEQAAAEEEARKEAKRKARRDAAKPEAQAGMPRVFRRSHNLQVAVAPPVSAFQGGSAPVNADLQAFLQESLYGSGAKRMPSASVGSLRRAGAATNFGTAAPPPARATKPKKEKVDKAARLTGKVVSSSTTPLDRRAAKLSRG